MDAIRSAQRSRRPKEREVPPSAGTAPPKLFRQVPELADLLRGLQGMRTGDFSVRMASNHGGMIGKIAETFNDIAAANQRVASELNLVGEVVGHQGRTRHRADFGLTSGAWGDMQRSVNGLVDDLLWPTKEVTRAVAAVAQGNLLQTVSLDVDGRPLKGEFLRPATIVNTMIKQLGVFTSEVTRVAREVGTEGKLGGQAQVPEVTGVWKDLTESVNSMACNLTAQVRNIADVTIAVANGDLSKKITVDVRGEILQLKEAINTMVDQLRSFASEVTRVAREVGTDGKLGGQAIVPGVAGTWKDLTDSVNAMCRQPHRPGAQHRAGDHGGGARRPVAQDHGRRARRNPRAQGYHQHDGRSAQRLRLGSDARCARGRHRRQARRPGAGAGRRRHVEGPDRQRQFHGREPDRPGAQHRRGRRPPSPAATCRRRSP